MSIVSKHLVKSYLDLFEGLDAITKLELIESLSKSLRKEKASKEDAFFNSFGAFKADETAEEIVKSIKASQ